MKTASNSVSPISLKELVSHMLNVSHSSLMLNERIFILLNSNLRFCCIRNCVPLLSARSLSKYEYSLLIAFSILLVSMTTLQVSQEL